MIETERLLIRKFTFDDLDKLIRLRTDEQVSRYLGGTRLQNPEAIEKRMHFYIECYEKFGFGMCAMIWRETGEMFGWSGLQPLEETGEIEIGYGMAKEFWRRGIGFECAREWLGYGFETAGLSRIVAVADPENAGSWRIMEKLGMRFEKTEKHYGMECRVYAISAEEFARQNF